MKMNKCHAELIIKILEELGGMNTGISGMIDGQQHDPVIGSVSFKRESKGKSKNASYKFPYRKNRSIVQ